jgi:hypothetical protein
MRARRPAPSLIAPEVVGVLVDPFASDAEALRDVVGRQERTLGDGGATV